MCSPNVDGRTTTTSESSTEDKARNFCALEKIAWIRTNLQGQSTLLQVMLLPPGRYCRARRSNLPLLSGCLLERTAKKPRKIQGYKEYKERNREETCIRKHYNLNQQFENSYPYVPTSLSEATLSIKIIRLRELQLLHDYKRYNSNQKSRVQWQKGPGSSEQEELLTKVTPPTINPNDQLRKQSIIDSIAIFESILHIPQQPQSSTSKTVITSINKHRQHWTNRLTWKNQSSPNRNRNNYRRHCLNIDSNVPPRLTRGQQLRRKARARK